MTGGGIDQILPCPSDPQLHEDNALSALDYVTLAERLNGRIPRKVEPSYIWGDALSAIRSAKPDAFIINLETAITQSEAFEPKGINYRMNPANVQCLTAAGVDCCALANNHVLDWGAAGLEETLRVLSECGVKVTGAGRTKEEACAPAIIDLEPRGRVLIFAFAVSSSGVPRAWEAGENKPGVNLVPELSRRRATMIAEHVWRIKQPEDIAVASIHWGLNWGYEISDEQRQFAHALIDTAHIDVVHGHSSHHPKAAEIYRDRPVFYGCGDFITDYEGIKGFEEYRNELSVLYVVTLDRASGRMLSLRLAPYRIRKFRLNCLSDEDKTWLFARLSREYRRFGLTLTQEDNGFFAAFLASS